MLPLLLTLSNATYCICNMGQNRNKRAQMFSLGPKVSLTTRQMWISTWSFPELWPTGDAKTPAERAKLMEDHMKLMQSGMAMLGQLRGGTTGMGGMMNMQMERRMAMMEQMMQMMVDREAVRPRK